MEQRLADPECYLSTDPQTKNLPTLHANTVRRIGELEETWLELSERLDSN